MRHAIALLFSLAPFSVFACSGASSVASKSGPDATTTDGSHDAASEDGAIQGQPQEASSPDEGGTDDGGADGAGGGDSTVDSAPEDGSSESGSSDSSGSDVEPPDGAPDAGPCTITASGGAGGTWPCNAGLIYSASGTITGTWLGVSAVPTTPPGPTIDIELTSGSSIQAGSYPMGTAPSGSGTYSLPSGQAWVVCYNSQASNCGNIGSFSVDVANAGTQLPDGNGNYAWYNAYGTITASLPCAPKDTFCSGSTVDLTINWITTVGDGGAPDSGADASSDASTDAPDDADDGGDNSGQCTVALTGAINDTLPCTQTNWTYISTGNLSEFSINFGAADAGASQGTVSLVVKGPLQSTTYSSTATALVTAEGAAVNGKVTDAGTPGWSQQFPAGTWSSGVTVLGATQNNPAGWSYIGTQGSFTATLQPAGGGATGTVNMTINY